MAAALAREDCWPFDSKTSGRWRQADRFIGESWVVRKSKPKYWTHVAASNVISSSAGSRLSDALDNVRKRIIALGDDWDDQGAKAIDPDTFDRAAKILRSASKELAVSGLELPMPKISPCADGSIDLFWKRDNFKLLMNVQPDNKHSDFYGENAKGVTFKGPFDTENVDVSFFKWLLKP